MRGWMLASLIALTATQVQAQDRFDIAITVDDLPAHGPLPAGTTRAEIARAYAQTLKDHGARQVFGFVNASKVAADPQSEEVLRIWRSFGFPLGNHAFTHMNLGRAASLQAWQQDVIAGEPLVAKYMRGKDWHFFRYPNLSTGSGERETQARAFLLGRGYRVADVSVAFSDWSYTDAYVRCLSKGDKTTIARMKADYLRSVDEGVARMKAASRRIYGRMIPQVLLTHLGGWSALTMPEVLQRLDKAGARYVTLAKAEADPAYAQGVQLSGGGDMMERTAKARGVDLSDLKKPTVTANIDQLCR